MLGLRFTFKQNPGGNWVISIFSGQKPCTRIMWRVLRSFSRFSRAKDVISQICNNTKENFWSESAKMNVKFIVKNTGKILKISCVRCNFVKFEIHFFRLHDKKLSLVLLQITIYIISSWKMWKNAICFKLFRYKIFVHWKLKLLNFLVDSVLISRFTIAEDARAGCPVAAA